MAIQTECPYCSRPLKRVRDRQTNKAYPLCPGCGWGRQRILEEARRHRAQSVRRSWLRRTFGWLGVQ